jgi:DNA processing protein
MIAATLNAQERLDWLRLIRSDHVGPVTFHHLLQRYGSAAAALEALPDLARRGGRRHVRPWPRAEAERELSAVAKVGGTLVAWGEPAYPAMLAPLEDAPPLLTMVGDPALLTERRTIGVVGARNASAAGQKLAREIARDLGEAGIVVVSGLARGIDTAAHHGALAAGTAAVVAGGADIVYPEENRALQIDIAARGLIIAEPPVGTQPTARHFPRRNRLISGVSLGVLVVEAALRSGSLITARFAGEQGRDVFAMPGSPLDPRCRGSNDLIRHGAALVESAADILAALGTFPSSATARPVRRVPPRPETPMAEEEEADDSVRAQILERLSPTPVTVDELVRQCHLSPSVVATALLELDLAGRLDRLPGNQVALAATG